MTWKFKWFIFQSCVVEHKGCVQAVSVTPSLVDIMGILSIARTVPQVFFDYHHMIEHLADFFSAFICLGDVVRA